jgi:isovaleryl-CoA dehydrogenase
VAALTTGGNTGQLTFHLGLARRNGVTEAELIEAITHLAFYAGWPKATAAMAVANRADNRQEGSPMTGTTDVERIIEDIVRPEAALVDRTGQFPRKAVEALAGAGQLALTVPREHGGAGCGADAAVDLVQALAEACGSTAMVVTMHYAATAALAAAGRADVLREIGAGRHLTTLAFSESGSRAHFWAPLSTATRDGDVVDLHASKSWVTSAHEADSYVWSSRPVAADGPMTLWLVPRETPGLSVNSTFDGVGLRGNDSCPVSAEGAQVPASGMLGADGAGLDLAMRHVLPIFLLLSAANSVGLARAVTAATAQHLSQTRLEHLAETLAGQPVLRARLAQMQLRTDQARALLADTVAAVDAGRPEAQLQVLEVKAAAGEAAAAVADLAMVACGGAAFRKDLAVERRFRDASAARVMAPTTDALHDFIGRALTGLPLLG